MIQLIENKSNNWHIKINGVDCTFIPMALFKENNLFAEKANCENGLRWRINRKWVSYKQIKKAIYERKTTASV